MTDEIEMQGCEHCSKEFPLDQVTMMGEYWFCHGCEAEWRAVFDACEHQWEDSSDDGVQGTYCPKCSGFIEGAVMTSTRPPYGPAVSNGQSGDAA